MRKHLPPGGAVVAWLGMIVITVGICYVGYYLVSRNPPEKQGSRPQPTDQRADRSLDR